MEDALIKWATSNQEVINMSGDLLKEKGSFFLQRLCPPADFEFSNRQVE